MLNNLCHKVKSGVDIGSNAVLQTDMSNDLKLILELRAWNRAWFNVFTVVHAHKQADRKARWRRTQEALRQASVTEDFPLSQNVNKADQWKE
jgi:hypothetical protein